MAKVKRSQIHTFLNITPETPHILASASTTYKLLGDGVVTGKIAMNPKNTEETYIGDDSASISVDSYAPNMPIEQTAVAGDDVFDFIDQLRLDRAILGEAETDVVNVWAYETGGPTAIPAEQQKVAISVEDFGGDGGVPTKINYTINYVGNAAVGTYNSSSKVFTAT